MSSDKRLRVNIAERATFTTAAPDENVSGGWAFVPVLDFPKPTLEQGRDDAQEANNRGQMSLDYPTGRTSGYEFSTRVHTGTAAFDGAGGDTDPTICFAERLLESYFGAASVKPGATLVRAGGGSAGTNIEVTLTEADNYAVGQAVQIGTEVRFIVAKPDSDSFTIDQALDVAANYTDGTTIYGGFSFEPTLGSQAVHHDMNIELDGHEWLIGPGRITKLEVGGLTSREGLRYNFGFTGDTWVTGISQATMDTGTAQAGNSLSSNLFSSPLVGILGTIGVNGATIRIADASVAFAVEHQEIPAVADTTANTALNGRAGWEIVGESATGELTEFYAAARWTQFQSRTAIPLRIVIPVSNTAAANARGSLCMFFPQAQFDLAESPINDQVAQKITFTAKTPTAAQITAGLDKSSFMTILGGI